MTTVESSRSEEASVSAKPGSGGRAAMLWEAHGQLGCALTAGVMLLAANILRWTGGSAQMSGVLTGIAFVLGLYFGTLSCIESLRQKKLDINLLMVLGAVLAIFVGSAMEGALLLFLFTLSGALDHDSML